MKIRFSKGSENNPNKVVINGEGTGDDLRPGNGALSRREFLGVVAGLGVSLVSRRIGGLAFLEDSQKGAEFQEFGSVPSGIKLQYGAVEPLTINPNGPYDYFYKAYLEQVRGYRPPNFWALIEHLVAVTNYWYRYFNPNLASEVQPVIRGAGLVSGRPEEVAERVYKLRIFQCAECTMMAHWATQPGGIVRRGIRRYFTIWDWVTENQAYMVHANHTIWVDGKPYVLEYTGGFVATREDFEKHIKILYRPVEGIVMRRHVPIRSLGR